MQNINTAVITTFVGTAPQYSLEKDDRSHATMNTAQCGSIRTATGYPLGSL